MRIRPIAGRVSQSCLPDMERTSQGHSGLSVEGLLNGMRRATAIHPRKLKSLFLNYKDNCRSADREHGPLPVRCDAGTNRSVRETRQGLLLPNREGLPVPQLLFVVY